MNIATPNQAADAKGEGATIIIRKIKKGGHDAHHGGAWKVAYADFVTAMMAFFLLLWLLNATTEEQKKAISNYFAPESVSRSQSGSGGVLGGNVSSDKDMTISQPGVPGVLVPIPSAPGGKTADSDDGETAPEEPEEEGQGNAREPEQLADEESDAVRAGEEKIKVPESSAEAQQDRHFTEVEADLRQALDETPALHELADHLLVDRTDQGLRIQLVDQDRLAMFPAGKAEMYAHTREILRRMAQVLNRLPNRITISGHTDGAPFTEVQGYGNWELSSDRANAARRTLEEFGLAGSRIARVVGKADQEPLLPEDPTNHRNRRISIVVLNQPEE
ncbi:MAG: flagellar motor protein MotB [Alphaproteobacteria bacterium]|nr:flagellar motor protein MotB [Alphaproteobacteria bacterium]